jgi:hypothetical protein
MPTTRSKDPLTAAATSILLPALRPYGFERKTNRVIARVCSADILQFFDLQLGSYGSKDFCVNYASISLVCPRDYLILEPGNRLSHRNGAAAWFSAVTHEEADSSMLEVAKMAVGQAVPFFDRSRTLADQLGLHHSDKHHGCLEMACLSARLGRTEDAVAYALRAIKLYREDGREWCPQYITHCEALINSIQAGNYVQLLGEWRDHSIATLRLEGLITEHGPCAERMSDQISEMPSTPSAAHRLAEVLRRFRKHSES